MGRDLLGRELGKGIRQAKDGRYVARYIVYDSRPEIKAFPTLQEAQKWLDANRSRQIPYRMLKDPETITLDVWLWYFLEKIQKTRVRENTYILAKKLFRDYIRPVLGEYRLRDIRPDAVQRILIDMKQRGLSKGTIEGTRKHLHIALDKAVEFELLKKNPVNRLVVVPKEGYRKSRRKVLSKEEQGKVIQYLKGSIYYDPIVFLLLTGLRIGEMVGLTWDDIDFNNETIAVRRTMESLSNGKWRIGPPKSRSSERVIPMNEECKRILLRQQAFDQALKKVPIQFAKTVFLMENGFPRKNYSYNAYLLKVADALGIERFSPHALRHTYATRCLEEGMNPKALQVLMGHSSLEITLNKYVHVSEEERIKEILTIEDVLDVETKNFF